MRRSSSATRAALKRWMGPGLGKKEWKVFVDLQCKYSKICWRNMPEIEAEFGGEYDFSYHLTNIAYHLNAFPAHCSVKVVERNTPQLRNKYISALYENQERYMNDSTEAFTRKQVLKIFAEIAEEVGVFSPANYTGLSEVPHQDSFVAECGNFKDVVWHAWAEQKYAITEFGIAGAPKHVIEGELISDTESSWTSKEWRQVLGPGPYPLKI
eukprot:CAMPEP_0114523324 /NCGR_PEP_ID=MMETSP0109-20121206/21229_1 /TAXON_ID=29199 /ORGANISM="Chlorarachnion reptans, Strain CCCM449" /LENGTH=210 /DNA_ID=CAMNT_0001704629 /DNA_START=75 /DNA_END=707 /DNA_ORIENTATION=+